MKRSKIFTAVGAFVLTITALFANKATKKFTYIITGYIPSPYPAYIVFNFSRNGSAYAFTNTASAHPVYLNVDGAAIYYLKTKRAGTSIRTVYFQ